MPKFIQLKLVFVVAVLITACVSKAQNQSLVQVKIGDKQLQLELADTYEERAKGLQHRQQLCADCGMLFQFEQPVQVGFWMKDTYIPLDIAYLNAQGKILFIGQMRPLSEKSLQSPENTSYAWEMNQGWFKANQIKVGDTLQILK